MPKSKEAKLEDQLKRLEAIVTALEGEDVALEDSLKLFEEGVQITRDCRTRLEDTQKKIEVLVKAPASYNRLNRTVNVGPH